VKKVDERKQREASLDKRKKRLRIKVVGGFLWSRRLKTTNERQLARKIKVRSFGRDNCGNCETFAKKEVNLMKKFKASSLYFQMNKNEREDMRKVVDGQKATIKLDLINLSNIRIRFGTNDFGTKTEQRKGNGVFSVKMSSKDEDKSARRVKDKKE
jgi:hypothetical protein